MMLRIHIRDSETCITCKDSPKILKKLIQGSSVTWICITNPAGRIFHIRAADVMMFEEIPE